MTARVILAEAVSTTRAELRLALEEHGIVVVAEVRTAEDAVLGTRETRPDVCLLDLGLAGALHAIRAVRTESPATRVVGVGGDGTDDEFLDVLRAGAIGYLLRGADPDRLAFTVQGVVAGEAALPRALTGRLVEAFRRGEAGRPVGLDGRPLSEREAQVLSLFEQGLRTAEVGARLGLSAVTVRRHAASAARKLGAGDRDEAIARFRASMAPPA